LLRGSSLTGKVVLWGGLTLVTAAVTFITVYTAGTGGASLGAAGSYATWIGSQVGMAAGVGSGSAAAGLAMLGGGTVASGGLGMAGGAAVVSAVTDIGLMASLSVASSTVETDKDAGIRYSQFVIELPETGSKKVRKVLDDIRDAKKRFEDDKIKIDEYRNISKPLNNLALAEIIVTPNEDKDFAYDQINCAILNFNIRQYSESKHCLDVAEGHIKNHSFVNYLSASIDLSKGGDKSNVEKKLRQAIKEEPEALKPYILLAMVLEDQGKYDAAIEVEKGGIKNVGSKFELTWKAGEDSLAIQKYDDAIQFYQNAYSSINSLVHWVSEPVGIKRLKADCYMKIALAYKKSNQEEKGYEFFKKAVDKLDAKGDKNQYREIWKNG
jgi:tetratricopeptide (TPR) repeat protein